MRAPRALPSISKAGVAALAVIVAAVSGGLLLFRGQADADVATRDHRITVPGGPGADEDVVLDATLYLPEVVPAPAVIVAHGFGGSKLSVSDDARELADQGFVVLAYSARGFGESTGRIALSSLDYEVPDARALVDWLAQLPEVVSDGPGDPRVGVTGASYGGALSLMLAGTDPRVDAVVPLITWNNLSQALFPNGVVEDPAVAATPAAATTTGDGVFKKSRAASLIASLSPGVAPASAPDDGGSFAPAAVDPQVAVCGRLDDALCAAYAEVAQSGRLSPELQSLLDRSSPQAVAGNITAPTLIVQGEQDTLFGLDQADANAAAIAANGATVAVSWYSGGHDADPNPDQATRDRINGWLSYYLLDVGAAPSTGFVYDVAGPLSDTGEARNRTIESAVYPGLAAGTETPRTDIPLAGEPQTVVNPPGGVPAAISSAAGASALLAGLAGSSALGALTTSIPGQTARFTSQPLSEMTLVSGTPQVTIELSAQSGTPSPSGAVLYAALSEISPSGTPGAAGTAVVPLRVTDVPSDGTTRLVSIDLAPIALQVEAGNSIQLTVTTTDQAFAGATAPAVYQIALAGAGTISIPQVNGALVSAGEVPVGLLLALAGVAILIIAALILAGRDWTRRRPDTTDVDEAPVPLVISGLQKSYPGGLVAVDDVSLRVERGQVLGLLGPNGAGKTTTLRMVMGLIKPSAGEIRVFGQPVHAGAEILARIGSFVEGSGFLPHLSGAANLELYWRSTARPMADARFEEALEIAGLGAAVDRKVRTYSQGMRQRLAIAQAMLGLPDLLILDEPTNGLDPPQIHAMREVLRRYALTGRTVLVSSHLLSEVEQTCSHVVVVHRGRTIAAGTVAELVATSGDIEFNVDDTTRAAAVLNGVDGVNDVRVASTSGAHSGAVYADLGGTTSGTAVTALVTAGVVVSGAAPRQRLEDVFLDLIANAGPPRTGGS